MGRLSVGRSAIVCGLIGLLGAGQALGQARPYLFGVGRYSSLWRFGRVDQAYDRAIWDHMVTIGATISGTGLAWCDGEPVEGQYNWDVIDYTDFCVDEMRARGIEPTMFVGLTPQWAKLYPELEPHQTPPREDCVTQFMDFHRFVANRYKGRVRYYCFWNEPNGCSWINGCSNADSYPLYTKWLIRCSQAIKGEDPAAKIVAANIDYHSGVAYGYQYIQGMYNEGAGPHFDVISIHPYDWSGTIHWRAVTDTRNVMVANGDAHKPIWISEYGWNSTDYQLTADKMVQVLTELKKPEWSFVEQANYLVLNGVADVENYGLMDKNLNARAGYYAFRDFDKTFPPAVDFSVDVTRGTAPLTVHFTDQSYVAGATAWAWEFGDGQTSAQQHPAHVYESDGSYTVRLTVTGTGGPQSAEKTWLIRVGSFPKVAFLGGQLPPTSADFAVIEHLRSLGLDVDAYDDEPANRPAAGEIAAGHDLVMASSTVLSGNVAGDFRHETVPFIFWESSLASSTREAMGDGAYAASGQTQVNVLNNTHPIMEGVPTGIVTLADASEMFSYCTQGTASGVQVLATSTSDPNHETLLVAEPGAALLDGGTAAGLRIMLHLYDTTWQKTNAMGRMIFTNSVAYALGKPTADFTATPTSGRVPATITFTDQSTGAATSWTWDFGDGATSQQKNPSHTYQAAGTYTVMLTVDGPGGPNSQVQTDCIVIVGRAAADFDSDGDVDQVDFGHLQACLTGAGLGPPAEGCDEADLDGDTDVDDVDFGRFRQCLSGPGVEPELTCEQQ